MKKVLRIEQRRPSEKQAAKPVSRCVHVRPQSVLSADVNSDSRPSGSGSCRIGLRSESDFFTELRRDEEASEDGSAGAASPRPKMFIMAAKPPPPSPAAPRRANFS